VEVQAGISLFSVFGKATMLQAIRISLLPMLIALAPLAADDKSPPPKAAEKSKTDEAAHKDDKLNSAVTMTVKVARVENSRRYLAVDVPYPVKTGRYSVGVAFKQVEMQANDDMKVRMLNPPADFDLKGRPRKYTSKELRDMKGPDTKLPGYTAEFDDIKPGQVVKLYLPNKSKPAPKPVVKPKDSDEPKPVEKPEVLMVVILQEPPK
jgi:hypothetical protein